MKQLNDYAVYASDYSAEGFWDKIKSVAKKAGIKVVYAALLLYYVVTDENVSKKDKALIYGALGYFILPIDVIPDAIPGVGYSDDLAVLILALKAVWENVTPEIKAKAKNKLSEWFGTIQESDLKLF